MSEEITTESWGSRLKNALIGILVGIGLIVGAIALIFWNEKHSLHTAQSLEQAHKALISVPDSPINKQNNLKVVYLSGMATTKDELVDSMLDVKVTAINLHRKVKMYQWEEKKDTKTEKQVGGSEKKITTYTYNKVWSDNLIDSSNFHDQAGHENPASMPIQSQVQYAQTVTVGDFVLPSELLSQIDVSKSIDLANVNKEELQEKVKMPVNLVNNNELYLGTNPQSPQLGDLKVTLTAVYPQIVSIIGQQTGNTLQAFLAPAGETVFLLSTGQKSADLMIEEAQSQNKMIAWLLRLVSLVMLIGGFALIMNPLVVLADVLPILGTIMGFGTGFIAFLCGLAVWNVATAIAWFATRPIVSIGLLVVLIIGGYILIKGRAKKIPAK
ncbi:TMEM43 family protein [Legionella waltersii]|uniref:Transmembrane protein n=1 Tax=Legionella waltersii TaxID=66969 RepID=A0A0W1A2C5_9GAMM|nr:TMEM43 family protein [Legionella waltersii]KTD75296.1 hypothetical protein Lwal_3337 [Legionella waltersii]SNV06989.1 Protein of uncharacterised function (DUF1625) [Legionella waltersii]